MILLKGFNRQFTIMRLNQFGAPKIALLDKLEFPVGSILHYIPATDASEIGPSQTLPFLANTTKAVQLNHVIDLPENDVRGRPRKIEAGVNRDILQYHRVNKRLRRMHNTIMVERDPRTLMVENYAVLRRLYRYPETIMSWYDRWHNMFGAVINQLAKDAAKYERQNYLMLQLPDTLNSIMKLRRAEKVRSQVTLETMKDDNSLFFLELWTWLGEQRAFSMFAGLNDQQLKRINIMLTFNGKFINLNLGELDFWRTNEDGGSIKPLQMQQRLYKSVIMLAQTDSDDGVNADAMPDEHETLQLVARDDADELSTADFSDDEITDVDMGDISEDEDFSIVQKVVAAETEEKQTTVTIDSGIKNACLKYIDAGTLSTKEYDRIITLSQNYKKIPNPFGEGSLESMLTVTEEDAKVESEVLYDDDTIFEKSMTQSSTRAMTRKYYREIMNKDISSCIMTIQKAGVAVTDYTAEPVIDAANRLMAHVLKVQPVKGDSSSIRFTTPLIDDDGYWVANDVRYSMRKQRVDLPIRKVKPDTVALTTFYSTGKTFIKRSSKVVNNHAKWLSENVVAIGVDVNDVRIKDIKLGNVFTPTVIVPRDYSTIAGRVSSFKAGGYQYNFDVTKVEEVFGKDEVAELTAAELTPIGRSLKSVRAMDKNGIVYEKSEAGMDVLGSITAVLDIDTSKAPREFTEMSVMRKDIPLGFIFAYYYGLEKALKLFNVSYRVTEPGERVKAGEGDMVLTLKDSKVVLNFDNKEQSLIFSGLKPYLKIMRDFTLTDYNEKDVYLNLLQKDGLSNRFLNDLDNMENLFIDPISERMLKKMGEPTEFKELLRRANEMLVYDASPEEVDMDQMHIYGGQRIAGAIYTSLIKGIRDYGNKRGTKRKIDIPSGEVWAKIASDPSVLPTSDANPIQSIKEADVVTFGGTGGRSNRSMVTRTRIFGKSDLGVISGDTVDSGDVSITSYMVNNPIFTDVDGMVGKEDRSKLNVGQYISAPALLAPALFYDDDKRRNFIHIQHGSGMAADGYEAPILRTGFEKLVAHRTGASQANVAENSGKVLEVTSDGISVEYDTKPKTVKSFTLGKTFGRHEGGVYPHTLETNLKAGNRFDKGAILSYNSKFFTPDTFYPDQVLWKPGVYAQTVFIESTDTWEDSSAISESLSVKLAADITTVKNIIVKFNQAVHGLVKLNSSVDPDTTLCVIEGELTASSGTISELSVETLQRLSAQAPTAGINGVVDKIEIFYNGDMEDMSPSVLSIVKAGDKQRRSDAKNSHEVIADNGRVDSTLRIEGNPVELDTLVIRLYMTGSVPAIGGDKAVIANQMKTTFRRVMTGVNETDSGIPIDGIFGKKSVDDRQVLSLYKIGTTVLVSQLMSKHLVAMLDS